MCILYSYLIIQKRPSPTVRNTSYYGHGELTNRFYERIVSVGLKIHVSDPGNGNCNRGHMSFGLKRCTYRFSWSRSVT